MPKTQKMTKYYTKQMTDTQEKMIKKAMELRQALALDKKATKDAEKVRCFMRTRTVYWIRLNA